MKGKYTIVHLVDGAILPPLGKIWDVLSQHASLLKLDYFKKLVEYANMVPQFKSRGPMVLFAPSNRALGSLPVPIYREIIQTPEKAARFIKKHIVLTNFPLSLMKTTFVYRFRTQGNTVVRLVKTASGKIKISGNGDGKLVTSADIMTANGYLNIVDHVLLPKGK